MMLYDLDTVSTLAFKVKSPLSIQAERQICNIYDSKDDTIFLKSDIMCSLYRLSFDIFDNVTLTCQDTKQKNILFLEGLENRIYKRCKAFIQKKSKVSAITDAHLLRIKNNKRFVTVYGRQKDECSLSDIRPFGNIQIVFRLDHIWWTSSCYGISYSLLQIKTFEQPLQITCVDNEDEVQKDTRNEECTTKVNQLGKFKKMLTVGIPLQAVIQKMHLEQVDQSLILEFAKGSGQKDHVKHRPPPPPPPLPPPPLKVNQSRVPSLMGSLPFLKDISSGASRLRSVPRVEKEIDETHNSISLRSSLKTPLNKAQQLKPPTLEDILKAKSGLKKPHKLYYHFQLAT